MIVAGVLFAACVGAEKFTVSDVVLAAATLVMLGAVATVVPEKLDVASPLPAAVTARNCSALNAVLAVRPPSVTGEVVPVAVAHVDPPSVENS